MSLPQNPSWHEGFKVEGTLEKKILLKRELMTYHIDNVKFGSNFLFLIKF
jgi:hypothetical protein